MNFYSHQNPKLILWPVSGVLLGGLVASNPFYAPAVSLPADLLCLAASLGLTLWLCRSPTGARIAVLLSGLAMCVPCFVEAKPLERALLTCLMGLPVAFAAVTIPRPAMPRLRERVAFLTAQFGNVTKTRRRFAAAAYLQMVFSTAVFVLAMMVTKAVPAHGGWFTLRWLAGGIVLLAGGEIITGCQNFWASATGVAGPCLFRSPWLASSVGEFWSARWNIPTSRLFHDNCFILLARRNVWLAITATFFVSGILHLALAYVATLNGNLSLLFGLFFMVQPVLMATERAMAIRRWPRIAAHIWTLGALYVTAPLLVEPCIQVFGPDWGGSRVWLVPTIWVFGAVFGFCGILSLAAAWSHTAPDGACATKAPSGA
jgi:hypothetical protein